MNEFNKSNYYRIMLGRKSVFAKECHEEKWIGGGWAGTFSDSIEI